MMENRAAMRSAYMVHGYKVFGYKVNFCPVPIIIVSCHVVSNPDIRSARSYGQFFSDKTADLRTGPHCPISRGATLGVRCGEIWLISSSTLPGLGRVSAKNVNKITDFNTAVSSPADKVKNCAIALV